MPPVARAVLKGLEYFTWPLRIDDYLALISPLWSTEELRGRIQRVHRETPDAVTVFVTPGFRWAGHRPGQYLRIGFDIAGKRYWRAYSLSSDAARPDGQITITVKRTEDGVVSQFLNSSHAAGAIVTLGEVEGEFTLPATLPPKLLFVTAGSGITPVMAMLRSLHRTGGLPDIVHLHSAHTEADVIFANELQTLNQQHVGYRFTSRATGEQGRLEPAHLDELCPDWRDRHTYACGPGALLDALGEHFEDAGARDRLHIESFEHLVLGGGGGAGGTITLSASDITTECDGATPILVAGEEAGAALPFGCRMGICHTCTATLTSGSVRDLRTGETTRSGTEIRTCVNSPDGPVTINL